MLAGAAVLENVASAFVLIEGKIVRCPNDKGANGDLTVVGCGSTHLQFDDSEKLFDCLECGIWFNTEEALSFLARLGL